MSEKEPVAYYFGRRSGGIFLGLDGKGLALAAVILVLAIIVFIVAGLLPAVIVAVLGAGVLWAPSPSGAPLRSLAAPVIRWVRASAVGTATAVGTVPTVPPSPSLSWRAPYNNNIQIVNHEGRAMYQRANRGYVGVWHLESLRDFALCSIDEQEESLRRWGSTISSVLAAPAVHEFQWLVETLPDPGSAPANHLAQWLAQGRPPDSTALSDYRELLSRVGSQAHQHRLLAAVSVEPRDGKIASASDELSAVEHRLLASGLPVRALNTDELSEHLAMAVDPDRVFITAAFEAGGVGNPPPPEPGWCEDISSLDLSHSVSISMAVTELPRTAVGPDWLWPLLTATPPGLRYVVAVHMTPIAPWLAMRHAEAAVTSAESEARRRQRAGGIERARDRSVMTALLRREEEIASGESLVRTKIIITITGRTKTDAEAAKEAVIAAARRSRLEVRTLYGAQREGWESTLALCKAPSTAETHETTTRHARSLFPAQISAEQAGAGILIGQDALSGSPWSWDPFVLYRRQVLTNPNCAVLGQVGRGKSSIVKSLLARGVGVFGYRAWILDPKGEYAPLAQELSLPLLRLQPHGSARINPLDVPTSLSPTEAAARRGQLLEALAGAELNRPLDIEEVRAIDAVCHRLPVTPTLVDAANALLEPDKELAIDLASSPDAVKAAIRPAALALQHLCVGRLAGMFDGTSTVSLDTRGGVIDLSATYSDASSLPPIMAATMSWLTAGMAGGSGEQSFLVVDEAWAVLATGIDFLRATAKLARSLGVSLILMMHRMSDLASAGDDASAVSKKASGLFQDVETVFAFGQPSGEADSLAQALELSDREAELLPQLGRGRCLAVVGKHHTLVDVILTDRERQITDTDAAMRQASDLGFSSAHIRE